MGTIKFSGQARHVVDQRPGEFSEDEYLGQKLINMMLYSGSYRIPVGDILALEQSDLEELQRQMNEYARDHHLVIKVEAELETGDYIVSWQPKDGERL